MCLFTFRHASYFPSCFFVSPSVTCPEPCADLILCQYYIVLIIIDHAKGAVDFHFFFLEGKIFDLLSKSQI
jgi:hypothetical protein